MTNISPLCTSPKLHRDAIFSACVSANISKIHTYLPYIPSLFQPALSSYKASSTFYSIFFINYYASTYSVPQFIVCMYECVFIHLAICICFCELSFHSNMCACIHDLSIFLTCLCRGVHIFTKSSLASLKLKTQGSF